MKGITILAAALLAMPVAARAQEASPKSTTIGGTAFLDFSNIAHTADGTKQKGNGTNLDLKRFYVVVGHTFDRIWSANITTDATYDGTAKASQIFIKKAWIQAKVAGDLLTVRLGSADLPWVPFAESLYGYRYVENTLIDRTKYGTSADWGAHVFGNIAFGNLAGGLISYQLSVLNGAGYKKAPIGGGTNRSKSLDVEGRVSLRYDDFVLGVGGYNGKLGQDIQGGAPTYHSASRFNAVAAWVTDDVRAGVEYFQAGNWNNIGTLARDSAEGWSGFASYRFLPGFAAFARYDDVAPSRKINPALRENYYNLGVTWSPAKAVDLSLVYKRGQASHGTISTTNGDIGGRRSGAYDEAGLFAQIKW